LRSDDRGLTFHTAALRRHGGAAISNLARFGGDDAEVDAGWKIDGRRIAGKHVGARSNADGAAVPLDLEAAAQEHQTTLFAPRPTAPRGAARDMADAKVNGAPAERARREIDGGPGAARRDRTRSKQQPAMRRASRS